MSLVRSGCLTLDVADLDRARAFYGGILGLDEAFAVGDWVEFRAPDLRIALRRTPERPEPGGAALGLASASPLAEVRAALATAGVAIDGEERDEAAGVRLLHLRDPDGRRLYFWERLDG
ncbi:MAG: VOC family protein [Planctomycetota bacterium]